MRGANTGVKRPAHKHSIQPEQVLALGFLALILVGGLLLALPAASADGRSIGLMNAMFSASSSVCVSGMNTVDISTAFSRLGRGILLVLIQIGGLGFMIFATLGMLALGMRISLRSRVLIRDSMNQSSLSGLMRLSTWTILLSAVLEVAGALLLMIRFIPAFGVKDGIWHSFFYSISAFCNAGFDPLNLFLTMPELGCDPLVQLTMIVQVIFGSMGFVVILELFDRPFSHNRLSLHSKVVLLATVVLLLGGAVIFAFLEWQNPATLGGMSTGQKLLISLFHSTSCRSSGFCGVDPAGLTDCSKLVSCLLMFIGASPASTGGGVKTTTFSMLLVMMAAISSGREDYILFKKRIAREVIDRSVTIVFIMLASLFAATCLIVVLEDGKGFGMMDLLLEVSSAATTTGISAIGTSRLGIPSQLLLMLLMYLGRVGPLTLSSALAHRQQTAARNRIRYPEENIIIG